MAKYTKCPKCKNKKTALVTSKDPIYLFPDQEPYKSGQIKEIDLEVRIETIGCYHCEKCNHSFGIWIEEA